MRNTSGKGVGRTETGIPNLTSALELLLSDVDTCLRFTFAGAPSSTGPAFFQCSPALAMVSFLPFWTRYGKCSRRSVNAKGWSGLFTNEAQAAGKSQRKLKSKACG